MHQVIPHGIMCQAYPMHLNKAASPALLAKEGVAVTLGIADIEFLSVNKYGPCLEKTVVQRL